MNILIINHYAGTPQLGMEFRPYYLAREWVKMGHSVSIIASSQSHIRCKQPVTTGLITHEDIEGIHYIWVKTPSYSGSLSRIINILCFMAVLIFKQRFFARTLCPQLVIASSTYPLDNVPAYHIAKNAHGRFIYEIHDLWPLSPMVIGHYSAHHPYIQLMQWAENFAYKHVDEVVSLLWNAEGHAKEHGLGEGKFRCIPNGFHREDWEGTLNGPLPEAHIKAFADLKDKIIIGFAGGFAPSGKLSTLIETAALMREEKQFHFVLVGKGKEENDLRELVRTCKLDNVTFLPPIEKKLIPSLLSHFDICYMGGVHSILHQYGTSYNKMVDYMLSRKPIVQAVDEPNSLIVRVGCGIQVPAETPQANAEAILKLASLSMEEREQMGQRGETYVRQNLEWSKLAKEFID